MGKLKPIGSEKLTGDAKIKRIIEISRFGEVDKNKELHTETNSFTKKGADGNVYAIIQERDGYYLKCGINESTLDYVSGFMNKKRDRFKSYGAALKRMNLIFKPLNEEHNEGKGIPMYEQYTTVVSNEDINKEEKEVDEQEKFVLNVPNEGGDEEVVDTEVADIGGEDMVDDVDVDVEDEMGDEEMDVDVDVEDEGGEEDMEGFMKSIQKLTGKLGQKLRDVEEEMGSADIKYVINSVISAVDLDNLDDEDREDILDRFEEDESDYGDEEPIEDLEMDDEELDLDMGDEDMGDDELEVEDEEMIAMESLKKRVGNILEAYIDKREPKKQNPKDFLKNKIDTIIKKEKIKESCSSIEQELGTKKFLKENKGFVFNGTTQQGTVVLVKENEKVFISKGGEIQ